MKDHSAKRRAGTARIAVLAAALLAASPTFAQRSPLPTAPPSITSATPQTSIGTRDMARRLAHLVREDRPGKNPTLGCEARLAVVRSHRQQAAELRVRLSLTIQLSYELLRCGQTQAAIDELLAARRSLREPSAPPDQQPVRVVGELLTIAYLRLGEQDNCLALHGPESCLMPLRGSGIHTNQRGARAAVEELIVLLQQDPDNLADRWLLNLAYMALGQYPDHVPTQWLIPPSTFDSDYDMKPFPNVAASRGVAIFGLSGGVSLDDFDGDGSLDIIASAWGARDQLRYLHNDGKGNFTDWTEKAGLIGEVGGLNLCHADYDNDGDPDVLVLRGAWLQEDGRHPNSLLRNNGAGTFADVTEEAGMLSFHPTQTAAWADYDNDGWLDVFIGNESTAGERHPCELYRNNGDGTFTDLAVREGVAHVGFVKGATWGDYDNDGLPDLYLSRMGQTNVLYRNQGSGQVPRFIDVSKQAGVEEPINSFATWFWDYDNDGWLDLLVAPFPGFGADSLEQVVASYLGLPSASARPRLYHNRGDGRFDEVSRTVGLSDPLLAMGANFGDLDNDGFSDMYFGTGEPNLRTLVPNRMYRNDGGSRFQDVTTSGGFGHLQKGHGIAFGDIDSDGDQDIYAVMGGAYASDLAYNSLFLNPGHGNHWITLRLQGVRSNRAAIGARIKVVVQDKSGSRSIYATVGTGGSFGASSLQQEIGLGQAASIREIEIRWPAGGVQRIRGALRNQSYVVQEEGLDQGPGPRPFSLDGKGE
jgi:hypothetical protein